MTRACPLVGGEYESTRKHKSFSAQSTCCLVEDQVGSGGHVVLVIGQVGSGFFSFLIICGQLWCWCGSLPCTHSHALGGLFLPMEPVCCSTMAPSLGCFGETWQPLSTHKHIPVSSSSLGTVVHLLCGAGESLAPLFHPCCGELSPIFFPSGSDVVFPAYEPLA